MPAVVPAEKAEEVLLSYLLLFRHGLPIDLNDASKHANMKERARKSMEWPKMKSFLKEGLNESGEVSWAQIKDATMILAKQYGRWQNSECEEMRSTLMKMEHSPGRVLLEDFHGSPKYPHYQFTEKEDYLQQVGGFLGEFGLQKAM